MTIRFLTIKMSSMGSIEIIKLEELLQEKKISTQEFQTLKHAIEKKHVFTGIDESIFFNPYQHLSVQQSFLIGLFIIITMSFIGAFSYIEFPGVFDYNFTKNKNFFDSFILLTKMNLVNCLSIALVFFYISDFNEAKNNRFIDFLSFAFLARLPYFCATVLQFTYTVLIPNYVDLIISENYSHIVMYICGMSFLFFYVWQAITVFFMLKESSGLSGKKLMHSFIFGAITAEIISNYFIDFVIN